MKLKKHRVARKLLSWLSTHSQTRILNATGSRESIEGIQDIEFGDLIQWRSLVVG